MASAPMSKNAHTPSSTEPGARAAAQSRWSELERLVQRAASGDRRELSLRDAERLALLYRWTAADLLRARSTGYEPAEAAYLEGLMRAAYAGVYGAAPRARVFGVWRFLAQEFPALVRQEARLVALSASLLLAGALCGAAVMSFDQAALSVVVPELHQDQTPSERVREEAQRDFFDPGSSAVFSSFLFTHNIQVTFLVFGLGISCGLGTAAVLFWNGIPLGALAAQYFESGQGLFFLAWILPHGVLELTVVTISGAAGFVLARGLLRPGARSRRKAFAEEAKKAVRLVLGGMPMLVVAGLVEGSLSQMHPPATPVWLKLLFAGCLAAGTLWYLARGGAAAGTSARAL
jgi:uncharacterized membrane protein SpoIIM required for sporulation